MSRRAIRSNAWTRVGASRSASVLISGAVRGYTHAHGMADTNCSKDGTPLRVTDLGTGQGKIAGGCRCDAGGYIVTANGIAVPVDAQDRFTYTNPGDALVIRDCEGEQISTVINEQNRQALITLNNVNVTSGFINRVNPTPPTGDTDSVRVLGSIPSSISWTIPLSGGSQMHPTQQNTVNYYGDIDGGGSFSPIVEHWWCVATLVPGGYNVKIAQSPGSPAWQRLWAYSSFVPFTGTSNSENAIAQLDNGTGIEEFGIGGTISMVYIPLT